MTAQIQAAIQRIYAIDHPPKATKAALMLSSMSPEVYEGSIGEYEGIIDDMGLENKGIIPAHDSENGTEALMEKCRALGKAMYSCRRILSANEKAQARTCISLLLHHVIVCMM